MVTRIHRSHSSVCVTHATAELTVTPDVHHMETVSMILVNVTPALRVPSAIQ